MKLAFQMAYKNLMGAGLRTSLNVLVLSFAFVVILFFNGLQDGWNEQARRESIAWQYGQGQLWHEGYDPHDPFTIRDAHAAPPPSLRGKATPVLVRQGALYPQGRMLSVALHGIPSDQPVLALPTLLLAADSVTLPALIGKRMAAAAGLQEGSAVLLRWRDKRGAFDARTLQIMGVFDTHVAAVDAGKVWMRLDDLQQMTGLAGEATLLIAHSDAAMQAPHWRYKSREDLLKDLSEIVASKRVSSAIVYLLLLSIALLAIFDTQVLSIFRRQKEIGTYIALGMTRWQVVRLFTLEGSMYSLFAMGVGCLYGIPLLSYTAVKGIDIGASSGMAEQMSVAMADRIYPVYGLTLWLGTVALVAASATVVSFLPARKIAHIQPALAIKGKIL